MHLPTIYPFPEEAEADGLIGHGPCLDKMSRELMAPMLIKLLRGAESADLLIEQPTEFELVVNLKTAEALGPAIPESFLVRAD